MDFFRFNKKSVIQNFFIVFVISFISFFILLVQTVDLGNNLTTESSDIACRSYVSLKGSVPVQIGEFFMELNNKCKKDYYSEKVKSEDEAFDLVSESMKRCWNRYGEGKYDFLNSFNKDGNWCFECAEIDFKNSNEKIGKESLKYKDYIDYLDKKKINETSSYLDYMNLKYYYPSDDDEDQEFVSIKSSLDEILQDGGDDQKSIALILSDRYSYLNDLRKKEINLDEKVFVVYRYDKPDKNFAQSIANAAIGAAFGMAGTIVAGVAVDYAFGAAICAFAWNPIGAAACLIYGSTKIINSVKKGKNAVKFAKNIERVKIILSKVFKFSKMKNVIKIENVAVDALKMEKSLGKISKWSKIKNIFKKGESLNLKEIESRIEELAKDKKQLDNLFENSYDFISDDTFNKMVDKESKIMGEIQGLQKEGNSIKNSVDDPKKKKNYVKKSARIIVAAAGAFVAEGINLNSNQYVDVMTQEQYYRLCGTQQFEK